MKTFPKNIAIIGVGLIGGSIALGLKQHFGPGITILGSCKSLKRTQKAKQLGLIDEVLNLRAQPLGLRLVKVNLIILATPINETVNMLKLLSTIKIKNCLIIDIGGTKKFVIDTAKRLLKPPIVFIGTHPMAGSDASGFENADPNLFRNKPWIVCNDQSSIRQLADHQLTIINELLTILGSRIIYMNAKTHDETTSWASHLNLVSASIITNLIGKQINWPQIAQIASTGFRDSTRLASSDVEVKRDIILTNKENIVSSVLKLRQEIDFFIKLLNNKNETKLINYLSSAKKIRDNWLVNNFA